MTVTARSITMAGPGRRRAHNAITYDGGKGQPIDDPGASGRLTDYWRCGGVVKLTGQAAKAYGEGITRAERTLIWLPNGLLLIYDNMKADSARKWEWNFHAASPIERPDQQTARIRNGGAEAIIRVLEGPVMTLSVRSGFAEKPDLLRLVKKARISTTVCFVLTGRAPRWPC